MAVWAVVVKVGTRRHWGHGAPSPDPAPVPVNSGRYTHIILHNLDPSPHLWVRHLSPHLGNMVYQVYLEVCSGKKEIMN